MNIMIDLRSLQKENGISRDVRLYIERFCEALCRIHPNDTFFLWTNSPTHLEKTFPRWKYDNIRHIHTNESNILINIFSALFHFPSLDDLIETEAMKQGILPWNQKFDVAFFPYPCIAPTEKNCAKIMLFHDLIPLHFRTGGNVQKWLFRASASDLKKEGEEAKLLFTPSLFTKNDLLKTLHGNGKKVEVIGGAPTIPIGREVDEETLQHVKEKYLLPEQFFFTYSTNEREKNIPLLIKAYSLHRARNGKDSWDLVLAGDDQFLKEYSGRRGIHPLGEIAEEDLPAVYSLASAFVYPSLFEGFGIPLLNAMAVGCPVISSVFSALPEIYGESALAIDPTSANTLFRAMQRVFRSPELQEELGIKGQEHLEDGDFSWEKSAEIWTQKVHELFEE